MPSASSRASTCPCAPSSTARNSGAPIRSARPPANARLRIAIKRVAEGRFSNWANDTLKAGSILEAMPPAGRFVLPASDGHARHVVAFAAGAGITPIIAMVKHALAQEPATSFTLVYGNRAIESILFAEELEDLKDRYLGRLTLLNVLSRNEESSAPLLTGRITGETVKALAATLFKADEMAHVFLCGPGSMIKEARDALLELGVPRGKIHHEFFAPAGGAYRNEARGQTPRLRAHRGRQRLRKGSDPVRAEGSRGDRHPRRHPPPLHGAARRTRRGRGARRRHPRALLLQGRHVLHLPRQADRGPGGDDRSTTASSPGRWSAGSS